MSDKVKSTSKYILIIKIKRSTKGSNIKLAQTDFVLFSTRF